jgi:hypothetical protein
MAAESILNTDILIRDRACICSFQKTSIPPPQRKLEVNPPTPFGCPNTFTIIRNNFFSPSGRQKFPPWGEYGCMLDHLCPMVHFSQSTMLYCGVISTKHTECIGCRSQLHPVCPCKFIGCRSQLHPVCPCKFIGDTTLSNSSLTVSGSQG